VVLDRGRLVKYPPSQDGEPRVQLLDAKGGEWRSSDRTAAEELISLLRVGRPSVSCSPSGPFGGALAFLVVVAVTTALQASL
jgi:hypothetical protein